MRVKGVTLVPKHTSILKHLRIPFKVGEPAERSCDSYERVDVSSPRVYKWWAWMSALKAMVLKGWE